MSQTLMVLWILSAVPILFEQKIMKMILYLGAYSLITSIVFLIFGAPDVALAEASISIFSTIFFIICFEKYYDLKDTYIKIKWHKFILPACFTIFLAALFFWFAPTATPSTYSMELYINNFMNEVGGTNAVTAIYLGYRLYDTVFEALMLLITAIAISHLSWHKEKTTLEKHRYIKISKQAADIVNIITPILPIFGIYLITYGHLSPGGGFQGGVVLAAFFVCRYMIRSINDLPVVLLERFEKLIFSSIVLLAVFLVFLGIPEYIAMDAPPIFKSVYLVTMNMLIGLKVALGFVMLFYRFITIERV
ncbi:MAG: DUF4040 domain-containing protein [Firmicutes bacterium]|nr:DUF4040 domain-containing protein [Bacillota bacterium]